MFHLISALQCCYAILKTVLCWLNMHVACGMEWDNHNVIISFNCHSNLQVRMNCNIWLWLLTTHLIISPDCPSWEVVCCLFSFSFFTFLSKEMISNLTIVNSNSNQSGEKYSSLFGIAKEQSCIALKFTDELNTIIWALAYLSYNIDILYNIFMICGTFLNNSEHRGQ